MLLLCTALLSGPVKAGELPVADPSTSWRLLTQSDGSSTSRCLGAPRTALCAVETLLACFQRGRFDLCRLVDDKAGEYATVFATPVDTAKSLAYRIVEARRLAVPPGETVVITVQQQEFSGKLPATEMSGPPSVFLLRQRSDGSWEILNWGEPSE
jgi:hypothetical protein